MHRKKDPFWQHVKIQNGRRSCQFCGKRFSGGISRFKSHLAGVTCRDIKICRKVPEHVKREALRAIDGSNKIKSAAALGNVVDSEDASPNSSVSFAKWSSQSSEPEICDKEDKRVVDKKLARFIIRNEISASVAQCPAFIDFVKSVAEFGPTYQLPSCSSLETESVSDVEKEVDKYVTEIRRSLAKTGGILIIKRYSGVSVRIVASTVRGTAILDEIRFQKVSDINEILSRKIEALGIESVIELIDPYNLVSSLSKYPQISKSSCASSEIEVLLELLCTKVKWVDHVFVLARLVAAYLYEHKVYLSLGSEYNKKKYASPYMTEHASHFLVLQSILELENELKALQLDIDPAVGPGRYMNSENQKLQHFELTLSIGRIICCNEFWIAAKEVIQVLQPLFQALHLVHGYLSTSGYLYEAFERAQNKIQERLGKNQDKYESIWNIYQEFRKKIIHPIHKAAAFLNPSYMFGENTIENPETKDGMDYVLMNFVPSEEKEEFVTQMLSYRKKQPRTFTSTAMIMLKTSHPRMWWEYNGDHLPILQKYAIRILSQPCSSASWEPFKLRAKSLENQVWHTNSMLLERYNMLRELDEKPIDLDKLSGCPAYDTQQDFNFESVVEKDWKFFMSRPTTCNDMVDSFTGCKMVLPEPVMDHNRELTSAEAPWMQSVNPSHYIDGIPDGLRPYILHMKDIAADGNCGFRAIADLVGFGEHAWERVRRDLLNELHSHSDHYRLLYGSNERVEELTHALSYFEACPKYDRWMTMPDMGHLIASCYNVVLYHLSLQQCLTFLPLRSMPVPTAACREIAIGFINGNHFVEVFLKSGHPIPPISSRLRRFHRACVEGWETAFISRIRHFKEVVSSDAVNGDIIEID